MTSRIRFAVAVLAATVGAGALTVGAAVGTPVARAVPACPPGYVQDTQAAGFQCVPGCPPGTLLDAVSHACVPAPGLPPPPLR